MMYYTEDEARKIIIEAGHRLVAEHLVARTWGNISARISPNQFIITPSGLAYEDLNPEDLVLVTMQGNEPTSETQVASANESAGSQTSAGSWFTGELVCDGTRKPSSEKGVHAEGYALRSDVTFIIHTHQHYASALSAQERSIDAEYSDGLGPVPCAFYALPGTKSLREAVKMSIKANPEASAFLMARHGTVLLGKTYEDAFDIATRLEKVCEKIYDSRLSAKAEKFSAGSAESSDGSDISKYKLSDKDLKRIYKPWLDDYAQIVGRNGKKYVKLLGVPDGKPVDEGLERGARSDDASSDEAKISGLTTSATTPADVRIEDVDSGLEDAEAIRMIMAKNAAAALFVDDKAKPMGLFDSVIQRLVYKFKYSKKKDN